MVQLYDPSEKEFQADVREIADDYGWTVFTTWNSRRSPAGEPDLRMVRPPRYLVAELKAEKGVMSALQLKAEGLLRGCPGVEYFRWYPHDMNQIHLVLRDASQEVAF